MTRPLLEVIALGAADAVAAEDGGADRVELVTDMDADGLSPEPSVVEEIRHRTNVPLRVMLRLSDTFSATGAEVTRLRGLASSYLSAGADGFVLGFLTGTLEVDHETTGALVEEFPDRPWTFHRAVDHALEPDRAWSDLRQLPGLTHVLTAGSPRGVEAGLDDLTRRAKSDPFATDRIMAGGGLRAEHVPWLAQAGIRAFHVGTAVRPDRSWKAYVDAGYVRAWRTLVDDEVARALDLLASGSGSGSGSVPEL